MHITTLTSTSPSVRYSRVEAINNILSRLAYTVDDSDMVYSSSEDGGLPLGTLASVTAAMTAYGCFGRRASDRTYGQIGRASCRERVYVLV